MFEIVAVTNRRLCPGGNENFLLQLEKIADSGVQAVILREKDLSPGEYGVLSREVSALCAARNVRFIAHGFYGAAAESDPFELPWSVFAEHFLAEKNPPWRKERMYPFGVSVHSVEESLLAARGGASWLIAGHVFPTQSKEGLPGRGLEFLADAARAVTIPVYAIGGITEQNAAEVARTGVRGVCLMSSLMKSENPEDLVNKIRCSLSISPPPADRP